MTNFWTQREFYKESNCDQIMTLLRQHDGEIQAVRVNDAINSGYDIDLDRVHIKGNLILSVAEASKRDNGSSTERISFEDPKRITSHIRFNHCIFEGILDFSNVIFGQEVSFGGSHFEEDVLFCPTSGGLPLLKAAKFQKSADLSFTHFYKYADFGFVEFKDDVTFQEADFRQTGPLVDFSHSKFGKEAKFNGTRFYRQARFQNAEFRGNTSFSSDTFFQEGANFSDALFYEIVWFYHCRFEDDADFSSVNFDRDAIFSYSEFKKDFSLKEARIKIMKLDGVIFESKSNISLKGSYFDRLVTRWDTLNGHLDDKSNDEAVFLSLVKNFNELGLTDDADRCLLYFKEDFAKEV